MLQVINQFSKPKNLVRVGSAYLFWKCDIDMILGFTKNKNEALLFTEISAKRFCEEYKIKEYTLEKF